jgi:hypothetical protein
VEVEFPGEPVVLAGFPLPAPRLSEGPWLQAWMEWAGHHGIAGPAALSATTAPAGLTRSVSLWSAAGPRGARFLCFSAEPREGVSLAQVESALDAVLAAWREQTPSAADWQRAVQTCRARRLRELTSNLGLALQLAEHEARAGDWRRVFTEYDALSTVTPEQARSSAARVLVRGRRVTACLVPPASGAPAQILGVPAAPPEGAP